MEKNNKQMHRMAARDIAYLSVSVYLIFKWMREDDGDGVN